MPAVYPDFYKIILTRVLHASGAGCDTELRHHPESAPGKMDDELTTDASGEELLTHSGNWGRTTLDPEIGVGPSG